MNLINYCIFNVLNKYNKLDKLNKYNNLDELNKLLYFKCT